MLTPRYIIGFTGHRSGYDETIIRPALTQVLTELQASAARHGGQAELYTSIAEGADTLCVEIARSLRMPVHLLLPLEEAEFAKDFSTPAVWQRAQTQINLARQRPGPDSVQVSPGETTRPECYFNQAIHMLDAVDVLVALWDGQPARGVGGTAAVVAQAQATHRPVVHIAAGTGAITAPGNLNDLFKPDARMKELNECLPADATTKIKDPESLQSCLDEIAKHEAESFRPSLIWIIGLHALAALLAALVTFQVLEEFAVFDQHAKTQPAHVVAPAEDALFNQKRWLFTLVELGLVSWALWLGHQLHTRRNQKKWIHCRFACELVRGLRSTVPLLDPLHPPVAHHDPE